jgi:hypothetical protein
MVMVRKTITAAVAIFILWSIIDFVMHGLILGSAYADTANLWRPMEEMNVWLIYLVTVVTVGVFTTIYTLFIQDKKVTTALQYGALFGLGSGFSMGYGSYAAMPIPSVIANTWFIGTLIKTALGGLLLGVIVKE